MHSNINDAQCVLMSWLVCCNIVALFLTMYMWILFDILLITNSSWYLIIRNTHTKHNNNPHLNQTYVVQLILHGMMS